MREIKFRAWDKEKKVMMESFAHIGKGGRMYTIHHEGEEPEYEVMQYTGLKDKNGKEIYEGDILANREVHGDSFYCAVEYQRDGFKGVTVPHRNHCRSLHNMMTDEGAEYNEVIGNIYENRDLLSKLNN